MVKSVVDAHRASLEGLLEMARIAPPTPPLDQHLCAKMFDITHGQFRHLLKEQRIIPVTADNMRYRWLRRWYHADKTVQAAALHRIREKFPEKIWSQRDM